MNKIFYKITTVALVLLLALGGLTAQSCDYTLTLSDSFGDGWDGATLGVNLDGAPAPGSPFTVAVSEDIFTITVTEGQAIELFYTAGAFENEHTYTFVDNNGLPLFSDGPNPATGSVFNGVASCAVIETCTWTLDMVDSFGDGWDGAGFNVTVDGNTTFFTATGGGTVATFSAVNDAALEIEYVPGNFENEHTYTITNNLGLEAAADGPNPTPGVVITLADGCIDPPACMITGLTAGAPTACGAGADAGNSYDVTLTVEYVDEPAAGTLDLLGQSFAITGSPQMITLTLPSNGADVDVTAAFSDIPACFADFPAAFTAPAACSDCGALSYDSGGPDNDYPNGADEVTTLCPDSPCDVIQITVNELSIEDGWDALYIHDGDDITAPIFASTEPATTSGFPAGGYSDDTPNPGSFLATGETGCITLRLLTDGSVPQEGFEVESQCIAAAILTNDQTDTAVTDCYDTTGAPSIFDPCSCNIPTELLDGNVVVLGNFNEELDVFGVVAGATWDVTAGTGLNAPVGADGDAVVDVNANGILDAGDMITDTNMDGDIQVTGTHDDGVGYTITVTDGTFVLSQENLCNQPRPSVTDLVGTYCTNGVPLTLAATDDLLSTPESVTFEIDGAVVTELDPAALGAGNFVLDVMFNGDNPPSSDTPETVGCPVVSSFSFVVTAGPTSLSCNDNVQVSLDDMCSATITPDVILEGADGCDEAFSVSVMSNLGADLGDVVDGSFVGAGEFTVRVIELSTGNFCWGSIVVEDKIAPTLDCPAVTVACTDEIDPTSTASINIVRETNFTDGAAFAGGVTDFTVEVESPTPGAVLTDLDFNLNFVYPNENSLEITVTTPAGTVFNIYNADIWNFQGCGNDGLNLVIDDDAAPSANPPSCASLVAGGSVDGSVLNFDNGSGAVGEEVAGTWTVSINNTGTDAGIALNIGIIASFDSSASDLLTPEASDNCGVVSLDFIDFTETDDCGGPSAVTTRTWTATDASGNTGQCEQIITFERPTLADVTIPADVTIDCAVATEAGIAATAAGAGVPTINGQPIVNGSICNITSTLASEIIIDDICPNTYKIRREWLVVDWCADAPNNEIFQVQYVKVLDSTGPAVDGGTDQLAAVISSFTASDNAGGEHEICEGLVTLPALSWTDDCGTATNFTTSIFALDGSLLASINTNGGSLSNIPLYSTTSAQPEYQAVYTATDDCGNTTSYSENFQTEDRISPNCVSDELTQVAIGADGIATVNASTFDDGSFDNCTDVHFLVDRALFAGDLDAYAGFRFYEPSVEFTCADVGQNINVFFLVIDDFMWNEIQNTIDLVGFFAFNATNLEQFQGHYNICMVNVLVEDKIAPFKVQDVVNDAIACDNYFTNFAPALDVAAANNDLNPQVLVDAFGDVSYDDNCAAIVTTGWSRNVNSCGVGSITRTWSVVDAEGNVGQGCSQTINVFHVNDWNIQFPADQTVVCVAGQDEIAGVNFGEANVFDDDCELVAISTEDETFNVVPDACYRVIRTYTAINWCVYDGDNQEDDILIGTRRFRDGGDGIVTYTQDVTVEDEVAPVITNPGDQDYCIDGSSDADGDCDRNITLPEAEVTDCSDNITVQYSVMGLGTGRNYSNVAPGTYAVSVTATDNCGNQSTIGYNVTVRDCKAPTPYCVGGLVVELMPMDENGDGQPDAGMVELWASDFNAGSFDNCTAQENLTVLASLSDNGVGGATANISFTCDNVGPNGVYLYIQDEAGNVDYCLTTVFIESVDNVCNTGGATEIAGALATENGAALATATVSLNNGTSTSTDANGTYVLMAEMGTDVTVIPEHDVYDNTSVTTFDLLVIRQHILTTSLLDSPYKMIAADVNNNGAITASDLVAARQVILGMATSYPNNNAWAFVDAAYEFPTNWTLTEGYPAISSINNIANDETVNFVAVRIGDVNGTYGFADSADERNSMIIKANDATLAAGQEVTVEFSAADAVLGYQFTLNFNNLEVVSIDGKDENFGVFANAITTSFDTNASDRLFAVTFKATADVTVSDAIALTSNITKAEAYSTNGAMNIALEFAGAKDAEFALYQNTPNPFAGQTVIGFDLPTASAATLTISDVSGKVLSITNGEYAKGYNEVRVSDLGATGVLYYQLDTQNNSAVRKMVVID